LKQHPRRELLERSLRERVLVFDGATGTWLQDRDLGPEDFGGPDLEGCNENLLAVRPELVRAMHDDYLRAGADIIETNSFGATSLVLAEYDLQDQALELNRLAARIAREAAEAASTEEKPRFVAGSMGPTTKTLSVVGGATFEQMLETYREQALGLIEGGADLLLLETVQDTLNVKAGLLGIERAQEQAGLRLPLGISCTIEPTGTMLAGQDVEAFWTSIRHAQPLFVGLNCSTGPSFMTDHVRTLAGISEAFTSCYPNAGLPDEDGLYHESPEQLAAKLRDFIERGWLNLIGGCCGTTEDHVRCMSEAVKGLRPRVPKGRSLTTVSGLEAVSFLPENRPLLVGERTNVIGSRRFKRLVASEDWDSAAEIGRRQVRGGAQVIDVCVADPDRDEKTDMVALLSRLVRKIKAPLMIDTTDPEVLEAALRLSQGKAIVNSINLEDGLDRFDEVCPLLRRYGAAVVVGCIDEDPVQGMAVTRQRKLEIAGRARELLTSQYGIPEEDLIFDPLVFPCGTGDEAYRGSAAETIEGVRLIKKAFPNCTTVLGVSNVSFGLPAAAREVVNSVFLHDCTKAGLDLAIVNTERIERYASINEDERKLAEDLLYDRSDDAITAIAAHFRDRKTAVQAEPLAGLPLDERIARHVIEGIQEGVVDALEEARTDRSPLEIINGPLMDGMDEVGRLFNANELIVAEVLQSAEVMKTSVTFLEQFMEQSESADRGKILLATVKGDVHDIGKNLVEIILSNNGYRVVNLGIKVLSSVLVQAAQEHDPDAIGLSGLLVKSTREMLLTARDLKDAGITVPVLVGGAALSRRFARTRIAPEYDGLVVYCKDATEGLSSMRRLLDEEKLAGLEEELRAESAQLLAATAKKAAAQPTQAPAPFEGRSPALRGDVGVPQPPDLKRHVEKGVHPDEVLPFLNEQVLYGRHLGLRGHVGRLFEAGDEKALDLKRKVEAVRERAVERGLLAPKGVWRYFPAVAEGDSVVLLDKPAGSELGRFDFPRQPAGDRICLADWLVSEDPAAPDFVAAFVVTCGEGLRVAATELKDSGDYLASHALQALGLEGAEAAAEWLHARLRSAWGFADPPGFSKTDVLKARYRGKRVSFGYPACPRLEDQATLFRLLEPGEIGVELTDGFMMDPEASVSALVFHHPDARYFSVGDDRMS